MAVLNIRNLPDEVHARLRVRAARRGRSMEAEARDILAQACAGNEAKRKDARAALARLQAWVDRSYARGKPKSAADDLIAERRREAERE